MSVKAANATKNGKIGVIATELTCSSNSYSNEILKIRPDTRVYHKALTPALVRLVEKGQIDNMQEISRLVKAELTALRNRGIDTLILGCSHYTFVSESIKDIMGEDITIINPAKSIAQEARQALMSKGVLNRQGQDAPAAIVTTSYTAGFYKTAERLTGLPFDVSVVVDIQIAEGKTVPEKARDFLSAYNAVKSAA